MEIIVRTVIHPTESKERVKKAVLNLFYLEFEERADGGRRILLGRGDGRETLERFYELLRSQCIVDSARRVLLASQREDVMKFELNKQAAFMGMVNFSKPGAPGVGGLGTLEVEIRGIEGIANWLAP